MQRKYLLWCFPNRIDLRYDLFTAFDYDVHVVARLDYAGAYRVELFVVRVAIVRTRISKSNDVLGNIFVNHLNLFSTKINRYILTGLSFSISFSCSSNSASSSLCFSTRSLNTDITLLGSNGTSLGTSLIVGFSGQIFIFLKLLCRELYRDSQTYMSLSSNPAMKSIQMLYVGRDSEKRGGVSN